MPLARIQAILSIFPSRSRLQGSPIFALSDTTKNELEQLRAQGRPWDGLDASALLAVHITQHVISQVHDQENILRRRIGIFFSSSRGATQSFEAEHAAFLTSNTTSSRASPTTTLGNISSWVAQSLCLEDCVSISHSMTCSSGLQALAHGIAWLKAGLIDYALCGASEVSCTAFTLAQMKALGVYSKHTEDDYPCRPFAKNAQDSSFVLGEAASLALLSRADIPFMPTTLPQADILGMGMLVEKIDSPTGVDPQGRGFYAAMKKALGEKQTSAVFAHAPGTVAGDRAELLAIQALTHEGLLESPQICSNKFHCGHSLASSGLLSISSGLQSFEQNRPYAYPYETEFQNPDSACFNSFLVNAAGFGGNICSLLISPR